MNRKFTFIFFGIFLLVIVWDDIRSGRIGGGNLFIPIAVFLVAFALIVIGFRTPKTYDKNSECPHCGVEGKNRDIFLAKGKDGKRLVNQCLSCNGGVYLDWNGAASKIPTAEWERIREMDQSEGRS